MKDEGQEFRLDLKFNAPTGRMMAIAQAGLASPDESFRVVAKAIIDLTSAMRSLEKEMVADGDVNLDPYLDFCFGDALDHAHQLLKRDDDDARNLAQCLIDMEKAVVKSKENVIAEIKRLGIKPPGK
jgi:hypothetical protein